jgi:hypothetical protein
MDNHLMTGEKYGGHTGENPISFPAPERYLSVQLSAMQPEPSQFEIALLALGVSIGCAALIGLSVSAVKLLKKWANGSLISFIVKRK